MPRLVALVILGMTLLGGTAWAQSRDSMMDLYGEGVHLFNAGQYDQARRLFTRVIDTGTLDPRVYYYRGLTHFELGKNDAGVQDFESGAQLEASDQNQVLQINQSLMRVQGNRRVMLERIRAEAKVVAVDRRQESIRRRYEYLQEAEGDVLLRPRGAEPLPRGADPFAEDPGDLLPPPPVSRPGPGADLPDLPTPPAPRDPAPPADEPVPPSPLPPDPAMPRPAPGDAPIPDPPAPIDPPAPVDPPAPLEPMPPAGDDGDLDNRDLQPGLIGRFFGAMAKPYTDSAGQAAEAAATAIDGAAQMEGDDGQPGFPPEGFDPDNFDPNDFNPNQPPPPQPNNGFDFDEFD